MIAAVLGQFSDFFRYLDRFWTGPVSLKALSIFRILIGGNLFILYSIRHFDLKFLFGDDAVVPYSMSLDILPPFYKPPFAFFPENFAQVELFHTFLMISLLMLTLGLFGRFFAIVALFFHVAFLQRNYAIVYGAEIVSCYWLFFLALADNSRYFSVRNLIPRLKRKGVGGDWLTTMAYRLIQIQICIIYAYTGWEKLRGNDWWTGEALWLVLGNEQLVVANWSFLKSFPVLLASMTHFTIIFEIYFPVLVWFKKWRFVCIILGIGLHTGIIFVMGLFFFGVTMMSVYVLFLGDTLFQKSQNEGSLFASS